MPFVLRVCAYLSVNEIQAELNENIEVIGIVPTMVDRSNNSKTTVEMLRGNYSDIVFESEIERMAVAANSALTEKSVVLSNAKDNRVVVDFCLCHGTIGKQDSTI